MRDFFLTFVATKSVSGDEAAAADLVTRYAEGFGATVTRVGHNIIFRYGRAETGEPRLLLNSHIDTVPPNGAYTFDPWTPFEKDGALYGLGSNDAKGCVTAMLATAEWLFTTKAQIAGEVVFCFVAEEETGGKGGVQAVLDALGPLDGALIGEPTSLKPCTAQRGMLLLTCTACGRSGHVANALAQNTLNAIHLAVGDIATLDAMRFEPHALLGETRAQVTQIAGGLAVNQIPDRCEFVVDLRTTPNLDHDALVAEIRGRLKSDVKVRSKRYEPKFTPAGSRIAAVCHAVAGEGVPSNTTSDWAFLGEIPAVKIGPGDTNRSHMPDEYLCWAELEAGVGFYKEAVTRFFTPEIRPT